MRRQIAAVAVVALLLFAGCNGGSGPATTPDDPMTTAPTDESTQEADPIYEAPLDAGAVSDAHVEALRDAGTYTIESNATQSMAGRNTTVETNTVVRGDLSTGAVSTQTESQQQTVEGYAFANGTAYQRLAMNGDAQYMRVDDGVGNASQYARSSVESVVGLFEFTHEGVQTESGATVHVYAASGADSLNTSAPTFEGINESMVQSANATLHVREDGVVTSGSYDITIAAQGQEQTVTATQSYTAIGETDVSPPEWIGEAQANTTNQTGFAA